MENASKALIIAGAILLSILIIALGMGIFNSAQDQMKNSNLSPQEISAHNAQFESYEGKTSGKSVRTLLNVIATNNEDYEDRKIAITWDTTLSAEEDSANIRAAMNGLKNTTSYNVTFTYNGPGGVIDTCVIELYT